MNNYDIWVNGNTFFPRLYGPGELAHVDGIAWTDQQGLREGHVGRFLMLPDRENWFHVSFPFWHDHDAQPVGWRLEKIWVDYGTPTHHPIYGYRPILNAAWAHQRDHVVGFTDNPQGGVGQGGRAKFIWNIGGVLGWGGGLTVSLRFSTMNVRVGNKELDFYAAQAQIRPL